MILDYVPKTKAFLLKVPRSEAQLIQTLITEHGFDFSTTASSPNTAVVFTREPYAAAAFGHLATPVAKEQLGGILAEIEASWAPSASARYACPADKELWAFQCADIQYALRRKNTLIGDQPGLGKTPTAVCFANEIRAKRVLAIVPANIRLQWVRRIREWTTLQWPYVVHPILHSRHGVHPTAAWTVVSYELARTEPIGRALARGTYDLLILDEAHYLKTTDSRRTRAVFGGGDQRTFEPIAGRAARILGLTGTPLPNRPREAYTLSRALCFDSIDWASEDHFRDRFNPSVRREQVDRDSGRVSFYVDERTGRHAELQNRLRSHFMVRHLKRDVLTQLKLPVYDLVQCEETGPVKQALGAESLLHINPENLAGADAATLGHIASARRLMGVALAPQVADYVDMLLDGGEEKLLVFAWHIEVMDYLERRLAKHGCIRIDGSTGPQKKEFLVERFIKEPGVRIALGNLLSMGTGTDGLQDVCSHALIAEPSWVPGENIQCGDRLDRGGQRNKVQIDLFVAPNSFAEKILAASLRKLQTIDKALDRRI